MKQPKIALPASIKTALENGAALAVSISGGKDSHALLLALVKAHREHGWQGEIFAIHADLGRAEWSQTESFVSQLCERIGIRLVVVRREKGDLLQEMEDRMEKLKGQGKPHFPSAAQRYCTSDQKRDPINKYLRQYSHIISAEGIRADESSARAKKDCMEQRKEITTRTRDALTWRPIIKWSEADVWTMIETSLADLNARRALWKQGQEEQALAGWQAHPAYVMGNQRLSCAICILGSRNDIRNGAIHNPAYYDALVKMEEESGFSFRKDLKLSELFN